MSNVLEVERLFYCVYAKNTATDSSAEFAKLAAMLKVRLKDLDHDVLVEIVSKERREYAEMLTVTTTLTNETVDGVMHACASELGLRW